MSPKKAKTCEEKKKVKIKRISQNADAIISIKSAPKSVFKVHVANHLPPHGRTFQSYFINAIMQVGGQVGRLFYFYFLW